MDSFHQYYATVDRLSKMEREAEKGTGLYDPYSNKDVFHVDLSCLCITPSYFDSIEIVTTNLLRFYEKHLVDIAIQTKLHSLINTHRRKDYEDVRLCLLIDVVRCYDGLNHPTSFNSPEGLALLILLSKIFKPSLCVAYSMLNNFPSSAMDLDGLVPLVFDCSEELAIPRSKCVISEILQDVDSALDKQYRILLYHFCEVVSQIDGVISEVEKEYLMFLLRLDDEDLSNDIITDSIFLDRK